MNWSCVPFASKFTGNQNHCLIVSIRFVSRVSSLTRWLPSIRILNLTTLSSVLYVERVITTWTTVIRGWKAYQITTSLSVWLIKGKWKRRNYSAIHALDKKHHSQQFPGAPSVVITCVRLALNATRPTVSVWTTRCAISRSENRRINSKLTYSANITPAKD